MSHLVNASQFDERLSSILEQLAEFIRQFLQLGSLHGCLQRSSVSPRNPISQVCKQRQRGKLCISVNSTAALLFADDVNICYAKSNITLLKETDLR